MGIEKSTLSLLLVVMFFTGAVFGIGVYFAFQNSTLFEEKSPLNENRELNTNIVAVDSQGRGVLADLSVRLEPGSGEVYYSIDPQIQIDLQYSANTSVEVASSVAGVNPNSIDVKFTLEAGEAQIVGGPSAGGAMTMITLAALENKQVKDNVVITGEIRADGTIRKVGGIIPKSRAAADAGKDLFLVPEGQSTIISYREVKKQVGPFTYVSYEPYEVDLNKYSENRGWGLEIKEVSNIQEAANLMIKDH